MKKTLLAVCAVAIAVTALLSSGLLHTGSKPTLGFAEARADESSGAESDVILTFGIGGVLARDGTLWQYRPDLDKWFTIDEAFREEGKETHILPLPVPIPEIQEMVTYGFIVTKQGKIWFYEFSTDKWRQLKPPGGGS